MKGEKGNVKGDGKGKRTEGGNGELKDRSERSGRKQNRMTGRKGILQYGRDRNKRKGIGGLKGPRSEMEKSEL